MKRTLLSICASLCLLCTYSCTEPEPVYIYGNIAGKVTDASSGQAIDGALVEISGIEQSVKTGSNGLYSFNEIPADDYTIYVSKGGYVSDSKIITVTAKKTAQGDFSLKKDLPVATPNYVVLTNETPTSSVELKNTRSGSMDFTVEVSKPWIMVDPKSGTIAESNVRILKISADMTKVEYGEHNETMVINVGEAALSLPIQFTYTRPNYVEIAKPLADETYKMGEIMPISWTSNIGGTIKIELLRYSSVLQTITSSVENNNGGTHNWAIPSLDEAAYQIKISSNDYETVYATSGAFNIINGPTPPNVTTGNVVDLSPSSLTIEGTITDLGKAFDSVSQYGHVYSDVNPSPTISDKKSSLGSTSELKSYQSTLTSLESGKTYYVRAYATNEKGTGYGEVISATVPANIPVVTTASVVSITETSAISGGNVVSDGGNDILERGICWSINSGVTIDSNVIKDTESKTGSFTSTIQGLTKGTQYFVRAYAKNSAGVGYGEELSFMTTAGTPMVTTLSVTDVTSSSAKISGNISSNGGAKITAYGFCYSTSQNPTTSNGNLVVSTDEIIGNFSGTITELTYNTTYFVRAYATNSSGTAYGEEFTFTTGGSPSVRTNSAVSISETSVDASGTVISDGGEELSAYGFCYSKNGTPTIDNEVVTIGKAISGDYSTVISNLQASTKYYFRAFATNVAGTSYGESIEVNMPEGTYVIFTSPTTNQSVKQNETLNITWETNATAGKIYIELWKAGNQLQVLSDSKTLNDRLFAWTVPQSLDASDDYTIRLYDYTTLDLLAESPQFTIAGTFSYKSPTRYSRVSDMTIEWECNYNTTLKIELFKGTQSICTIAEKINSMDLQYNWNPSSKGIIADKNYRLKITDLATSTTYMTESIELLNDDSYMIDNRDGQMYKIVHIGDQTWFGNNLNYRNSQNLEGVDGFMYTKQDFCPEGWRLPDDSDWRTLCSTLGASSSYTDDAKVGYKLKSTSGWPDGCNGSDEYGFNALYNASDWWSSTVSGGGSGYPSHYFWEYYYIKADGDGLYGSRIWDNKTPKCYIRCIKK